MTVAPVLAVGALVVGGLLLRGGSAPSPRTDDRQARLEALRSTLASLKASYDVSKENFGKLGIRMAFSMTSAGRTMLDQIQKLETEIKDLSR